MKQALVFIALMLPAAAWGQTVQLSASDQAMQGEILQQLSAKLQLQAQVIDLKAQIADLQKQLDAAKPKPDGPKP